MEPEELSLLWKCLYKGISKCVTTGSNLHLRRLLSVLVLAVKVEDGQKVSGKKQYMIFCLLVMLYYILVCLLIIRMIISVSLVIWGSCKRMVDWI